MATKQNRQLTTEQREALGLRVSQRRRSLGWSQRELGRRTGIRYVRLSKLEHGYVTPTVPELLLLSEALRLRLDEIVLGAPPAAPDPMLGPTPDDGRSPLAQIEELGSQEEWAALGKLLRATVVGLRMRKGEP